MAEARTRAANSTPENGEDKAEATTSNPDRIDVVVTYDVFTWLEPKVGKPGEYDHFRAFAGNRINIPSKEYDRAASYGAVALPDEAPAVRRAVESLAGPVSDDRMLAAMSAAELIAYVTQNPGEAQRVYGFEAANRARVNVMRATGLYDPAADNQPGSYAPAGTGVTHAAE